MKLRPKEMSIDKCAALVGVSRVTIMSIEKDHEHVKFGTVKKYCEVCNHYICVFEDFPKLTEDREKKFFLHDEMDSFPEGISKITPGLNVVRCSSVERITRK